MNPYFIHSIALIALFRKGLCLRVKISYLHILQFVIYLTLRNSNKKKNSEFNWFLVVVFFFFPQSAILVGKEQEKFNS